MHICSDKYLAVNLWIKLETCLGNVYLLDSTNHNWIVSKNLIQMLQYEI
jgi:hypothetical protein